MLEIWLPLFAIAGIAAWWYHALRLRERAVAHARELCERHGLQLLDDSVALHRLHIDWRYRPPRITREYRFDTSLGGNDRRTASLMLQDDRVTSARLPEREPATPVPDAAPPATSAYGTWSPPTVPGGTNVVPITRARRTLHLH